MGLKLLNLVVLYSAMCIFEDKLYDYTFAPGRCLNKGQIYLCPFGLKIDSKRPHVFTRLSYFTPECSVDKPLSNNLELIFFNRSLVHLL